MHDFSKKYNRKELLTFIKNFLPDDLLLKEEEYKDELKEGLYKRVYKLGAVYSLSKLSKCLK